MQELVPQSSHHKLNEKAKGENGSQIRGGIVTQISTQTGWLGSDWR